MKNLLSFLIIFLATTLGAQTLNVSNFKVDALSTANHRMDYSFNITGTYFKVDMNVYKNSVSQQNLISYESRIDESNFEQFTYPPGYKLSTYSWNYYETTTPSKFILVVEAWENQGTPKMTQTLEYTPPVPIVPNFKIDGFVITEPFNNNKTIFDSYNPGQYPPPTKLVQSTKTYNFKVFVRKEGAVAVNNVDIDLLQYDAYWGTYPNTSPGSSLNKKINFTASETVKSVDFLSNIIGFNPSQTIVLGLAFHVDKNLNIVETNESDNYRVLHVQGYPAGSSLRTQETELLEVTVLDEGGKEIKKVKTTSEDTNLTEVKKELTPGNYYLKTKNSVKRVKITK